MISSAIAIIVGLHLLSLLQGILCLQRDSGVCFGICLDGEFVAEPYSNC